jgi:hypothetical protein
LYLQNTRRATDPPFTAAEDRFGGAGAQSQAISRQRALAHAESSA